MGDGETLEALRAELAQLREENATLKRVLTRVYVLTAEEVVNLQRATSARGRPVGATRTPKEDFIRNLYATYSELPPEQQTREAVAKAFGISKRTLNRYLVRWAVPWPPVNGHASVEELVQRHGQKPRRTAPAGRSRAHAH
jgi:hypothetical protein